MSGGESTEGEQPPGRQDEKDSKAEEEGDAKEKKETTSLAGYEDVVEGLVEEKEQSESEEALKEKRSDDEAGPRTVLDKSSQEKGARAS